MSAALLAAVPSLFQAGIGLTQQLAGMRGLSKLKRPEYEMPGEVKNIAALEGASYADPYSVGELRGQNNIGLAAANAAGAARDSGVSGAMAPAIQAQENAGYNQLQVQVEADRQRRKDALISSMQNVANYRDQEWQMNKFAPYAEKREQFQQMVGAGQQNLFAALNGLSSIGSYGGFGSGDTNKAPATPAVAASAATSSAGQSGWIDALFTGLRQIAATPGANTLSNFAQKPYILPF